MILPVKYPFASTYPFIGGPLAILSVHDETYPWLMNNFIQIRGITLEDALSTYIDYYDFDYNNCPFLDVQKIPKRMIVDKWGNILDFIKESIDENNYVYMLVKMRCISAYGIENREAEHVHDLMVYGYSDEKEEFYIADNFNGAYQFRKCRYVELESSIKSIYAEEEVYSVFNNNIILMKYVECKGMSVNPQRIRESLMDYLQGNLTREWYTRQYESWMETKRFIFRYGRKNYKDIDKIVQAILEEKKFPNATKQPLHLIMQHHQIMYLRYKYLIENGYVKNEKLLRDLDTFSVKSNNFMFLLIKNNLSQQNRNDVIMMRYREIRELEEKCLDQFIEELSS